MKTTKIRLAYVQFYKTKLHWGTKRGIEENNYQRQVATLTDFWQAERPKKKKLIEKSQKLTTESRNMCQFWTWNAFSGYVNYCGINFRGLNSNIA